DGVGEVVSFETKGNDRLLEVSLPDIVSKLAVSKGSITIDGVSLTIADITGGGSVLMTIIPHTLEQTIIGEYVDGTKVNVEADILGKYVMEFLERIHST
ncbi:MAG: riboflavin synthase, partial [bacterium]|nr:riboflavin synthase [bacterium]